MILPYDTPTWQALNKRRHRLIDIKYTEGLNREQALELRAITDQMDEIARPYEESLYKPLQDRIDAIIAKLADHGIELEAI